MVRNVGERTERAHHEAIYPRPEGQIRGRLDGKYARDSVARWTRRYGIIPTLENEKDWGRVYKVLV